MNDTTGFFSKVYDIVEKIPEGSVTTYGIIANLINNPRASRIVGYAMNKAPYNRNLPCHRVVNKSGCMAPHDIFGGSDRQRLLLESEGVTFLDNGCIDMAKHLWYGK